MSAMNTTTPADKTLTEYLKSKDTCTLKMYNTINCTNMDPTDTSKVL